MRHFRPSTMSYFRPLLLLSLLFLTAATALYAAPAPELVATLPRGDGPQQIGITPPQREREPVGPEAIRVSSTGEIDLLDTLNHRILALAPGRRAWTEIKVPDAGYMADLALHGGRFYVLDNSLGAVRLVDAAGRIGETYPATREMLAFTSGIAVDPRGRVFWQTSNETEYEVRPRSQLPDARPTYASTARASISLSHDRAEASRFERQDNRRGQVRIVQDQNPVASLQVETAHDLGGAQLIGRDRAGSSYVLVQELLENVPAFVVETTVRRYSREGALTGIAHVHLEGSYFVPARFVDVSPAGEVYALQVMETEARVYRLPFQSGEASQLEARWQGLKGTLPRDPYRPPAAPASPRAYITRDQIIQNAAAYVDLQWTPSAANLAGTACDSNWAQPDYLNGAVAGVAITSVPYKWGGYDTIQQFLNNMAAGRAAGDIGLDQIRTCASGVDCSGFVSRVWNEARYTTYTIDLISWQLGGWQDLSRGDAANWRQGHILIFDRFAVGGLNTYESAGACGDHACRYYRSFAYLGGSDHTYVPIRYDYVQAPVCANAIPVGAYSSRASLLVDAYIRNGGIDVLGCTTNTAHWWPRSGAPREVVIQDLNSPSAGAAAIIHDEAADIPPNSIQAFVMRGALWNWYKGTAGQPYAWLGAPTTDEHSTNGATAQGFVNGRVLWQNNSATVQAWNENPGNWKAEYWNNKTMTGGRAYVGSEGQPQLVWGDGAPANGATGVFPDAFSARWTRTQNLKAGTYLFHLKVDDGGRLYIDNQLVIDEWFVQAPTEYTYTTTFAATADHSLRLDYYEESGGAMALLWWDYTDTILPGGTITAPAEGAMTTNPIINITANAWDAESGVNRVEFYAYYANAWHPLCSDATAPYACTWDARGVPDDSLILTIHVVDNAGNEAADPGGLRHIRLIRPRPVFVPFLTR